MHLLCRFLQYMNVYSDTLALAGYFSNLSKQLHDLVKQFTFIHSFILETYIAPLQDTTTQRRSQPSHDLRRKTSWRCKIWKGRPSARHFQAHCVLVKLDSQLRGQRFKPCQHMDVLKVNVILSTQPSFTSHIE